MPGKGSRLGEYDFGFGLGLGDIDTSDQCGASGDGEFAAVEVHQLIIPNPGYQKL